MRRAVFGEPLLAHPPKIIWIDAPGSTRLVEHHRANGDDESGDGDQHGLHAAGARRVLPRSSYIEPVLSVRLCTSRSEAPSTVQFGTAVLVAAGYTRLMFSEKTKTLIFIAWPIAVLLAAVAIGITSVPNWVAVAGLAVVPPLVVRRFWRAPEQTISESINEARRP